MRNYASAVVLGLAATVGTPTFAQKGLEDFGKALQGFTGAVNEMNKALKGDTGANAQPPQSPPKPAAAPPVRTFQTPRGQANTPEAIVQCATVFTVSNAKFLSLGDTKTAQYAADNARRMDGYGHREFGSQEAYRRANETYGMDFFRWLRAQPESTETAYVKFCIDFTL